MYAALPMEASTSVSQAVGEDSSADVRAPRWLNKRVGRFRLLQLLGKGSFGRVFLAEDVDLERRVALKILTADATARRLREEARAEGESMETSGLNAAVSGAVERMIREAKAAARLEHAGVVQIYEIGRLEAQGLGGFIAMELLEGGTLLELVKSSGPLDVQRACTYIAEAAEALQYAHDLGVVHRDVKPGNLMLSRNGRCKVADFGLACIVDPKTGEHAVAKGGTAAYMAPEVIRGSPPDPLSDQYALAATLYALLAGHAPFRGESKRDILMAHLKARVPPLREIRSDVDERLWKVIRRGLCKHPPKRFANLREFAEALSPYSASANAEKATAGAFQDISLEQILGPEEPIAVPGWMTGREAPPPAVKSRRSFIPGVRSRSDLLRWPPRRWVSFTVIGVIALLLLVLALSLLSRSSPDEAAAPPAAEPTARSAGSATGRDSPQGDARDVSDSPTAASSSGGTPGEPNEEEEQRPAASTSKLFVFQDGPATQEGGAARPSTGPTSRPSYIPATDYDRLLRIAQGNDPDHPNRRASVGGKVIHARTSDTGKVFRIYFEGTERRRSFGVVYFPSHRLFARMQEKFGGEDGSGMEGKVIRVTGTLTIYQDNPQIIVESPDQIEVVIDR